jgi:hypothetical protein
MPRTPADPDIPGGTIPVLVRDPARRPARQVRARSGAGLLAAANLITLVAYHSTGAVWILGVNTVAFLVLAVLP